MTPLPPRQAKDRKEAWVRYPRSISVLSYLRDHHFAGKTIYPAVEILQGLAATVLAHRPEAGVTAMKSAAFDRFLEIGGNDCDIDVFHDLKESEKGLVSARLVTVAPSGKTGIRREKIHAVVDYAAPEKIVTGFPYDMASSLEGICYRIPAEQLYRDLVPFGPAYRSLQGEVLLTENGGMAQVLAAEYPAPSWPLGSTFPFDGMMHIACAWSQRFHGIVAFPVGFDERVVMAPTVPGETYRCRVLPMSVRKDVLTFDMAIYDQAGHLREFIRRVTMRDVSGGRIKPLAWIQNDGVDPLGTLRGQCRALSVVEDAAVFDFADRSLTRIEASRFGKMGKRRQKGYLAGRLALKKLARKLAAYDRLTPAEDIHTMMEDRIRPFCPDLAGQGPLFCSLSHDRRFAVAVGGDEAMGVDVEMLSDRVLKARHLYMGEKEIALTDGSSLGVLPASLRVWSIKEGVAKAVNMPIGETWKRVNVLDIGLNESRLTVDGESFVAFHDTVDDHVFTLVKKES
jgi:phosphopantetheinyl transferase (holo-ACP synthase)